MEADGRQFRDELMEEKVSNRIGWIKIGFGSPHEDYWIGNDVIHQLTKGTNSSMYVEISPRRDNYTFYQVYRDFSISSEDQKYKLQLANPGNGCHLDAGSFLYHNNMPFSTFDADNDGCNCPALYSAGWWFKCCHNTNLNGPWSQESWFFPWYPQFVNGTNINGTLMLVRPQ
nr:ficolin-2-like [Crassostrea gigas]